MEIYFINKKLEKILTDKRLLEKYYGMFAPKIRARMTEFRTAKNLSDISHLPPPRRHKLQGFVNVFAVDISKNFRLVFSSTDDSTVELKEITEIIILRIEDYH